MKTEQGYDPPTFAHCRLNKESPDKKEHKMNKSLTKTRKTKSERLAYQLEQIELLWLDMDEFPVALDNTEEVAQTLRAAQADPTDKEKLIALAEALHGLEDEMYDNLQVTPQDCFNLAVGLEKFSK